MSVNNNLEKVRNFFSQNFEISWNSAQFRDKFRASDLCRKGGLLNNLSIHYLMTIVIQCVNLEDRYIRILGC